MGLDDESGEKASANTPAYDGVYPGSYTGVQTAAPSATVHRNEAALSAEEAAAIKIQAVQRGRACRKGLASEEKVPIAGDGECPVDVDPAEFLRTDASAEAVDVVLEAQQEAAAIKIQAVQRGRVCRAKLSTRNSNTDDTTQGSLVTRLKTALSHLLSAQVINHPFFSRRRFLS